LVTSEEVLQDLDAAHSPPHPLLIELEQRSREDGIPVSRVTGRFLSAIATAMQANRILEVGTGYGYSTLWMAQAQPPLGRIWTIDPDVGHTEIARSFFARAREDDCIVVFNTPAFELLENFPQRNLDIALATASEDEYLQYLDLIVPMLKLSGLVIFNDCLEMRRFARRLLHHPQLDATILPFGIGIGARRR
jgi:caffeoyl-CoA O-methyltransferase